jgi:hypothetical protein
MATVRPQAEDVADAEVNFATGRAQVTVDRPVPAVELQARVERIGYGLTPLAERARGGDDPKERAHRSWLRAVVPTGGGRLPFPNPTAGGARPTALARSNDQPAAEADRLLW